MVSLGTLRRIFTALFLTVILCSTSANSRTQFDPRIKVISVVTVYSIVGGTLLGLAAINFGASRRAPFIGASLGLYGGLVFGSYLVIGHMYKRYKRSNQVPDDNYYYDTNSIYEDVGGGGGGGADVGDIYEYRRRLNPVIFGRKKYRNRHPSVYIHLFKIQF